MHLALAGTREQRRVHFSAAVMAAELAGHASPPGEDTEPVLDGLLALEPIKRGFDSVKNHLTSVLRHPPNDPARMRERPTR